MSRAAIHRIPLAVVAAVLTAAVATSTAGAVTGHRLQYSFGTGGSEKLQDARQLAVSPAAGQVFVVDPDAGRVKRFTTAGSSIGAIDPSDQLSLNGDSAIAMDPPSGDVYVTGSDPSTGNAVVARYHPEGGFVSTIDLAQGGGISYITGLAVDSMGRVYLSDQSDSGDGTPRNVVQVFSDTGTRIKSFDGSNGPGRFTQPGPLAVGPGDSIYVRDSQDGASVVQRFSALGNSFESIVSIDDAGLAVNRSDGSIFTAGGDSPLPPGATSYSAGGLRQARFGELLTLDDIQNYQVADVDVNSADNTVFLSRRGQRASVEAYVPFVAPGVTTADSPTEVDGRSAQLAGSVNPAGRDTTYRFEYAKGSDFKNNAGVFTDPVDAGSATDGVAAAATLTGLEPNKPYIYRLQATNGEGSNFGEAKSFQTAAIPPTVSNEAASGIASTSATVSATVAPENNPARVYFEYGTTDAYGTTTDELAVGANPDIANSPRAVSRAVSLTELEPNTTYHYRAVANNGVGSGTTGADHTFTTAPGAPAASASGGAAQFSAPVNTGGPAGSVSFLVTGISNAFSAATAAQDLPAAAGTRTVGGDVTGLPAGGTYTVRVRVQTANGVVLSDPTSFSTVAPDVPATVVRTFNPFPFGCAAPRLARPAGTLKAGRSVVLTGSDLGVAGDVAFGARQAKVLSYSSTRVTVVVPSAARGSVPITLSCGRSSNTVTGRVASAAPSNRFSVSATTKRSTAKVKVRVPGRGALSVSGSRIGRASAAPKKAGTVTLSVALTRSGRAALAKTRTRRLSVPVQVRYRPTGGTGRTAKRTLVFRAP